MNPLSAALANLLGSSLFTAVSLCGCVACCLAALFFEKGYQRERVFFAAGFLLFVPLFRLMAPLSGRSHNHLIILTSVFLGLMAFLSVFMAPLLLVASLCESPVPRGIRRWQAGLLFCAWLLGPLPQMILIGLSQW